MDGFATVDCDYLYPAFAGAYLVVESGRAAFVENNTRYAVAKLLAELRRHGLGPEAVDYIAVTHVHLDHAGGTSALLEACPNAQVLAHPKAARHLKDPSRLIAGATSVYGAQRFAELYGQIDPVPANRVTEMQDGECLRWGEREWLFLHTRGHANHHYCLWDSKLKGVFTGDSFGICYPPLQSPNRFIFPSTSPTDFDAEAAIATVRRLAELEGDRAFLTHFGAISRLKEAAADLELALDFSQAVVDQTRGLEASEREAFCVSEIDRWFRQQLGRRGIDTPAVWKLTALDRELNAAGLAFAASRP